MALRDFHPSAETVGQWFALGVMAAICFLLVFFPVPAPNKELVIFALGAISGALTMGGSRKTATVTGANPVVQPDADDTVNKT